MPDFRQWVSKMTWKHVEYQRRLAGITAMLPNPTDEDVRFVLKHLEERCGCEDCCREAEAGRNGCPEVERSFTRRRNELMTKSERLRDGTPLGRIDARLGGKRLEKDRREADREDAPLFQLQSTVDALEEGGANRDDAFTAAKAVLWGGADAVITPTVKLRRARRR